jgi:pectate lyase
MLNKIKNHIETIIHNALDKETCLFANAIDKYTKKQIDFDDIKHTGIKISSNFARQQNWMRLLTLFSRITNDDSYLNIAKRTINFVFDNLTDSNGLIYWGGHTSYDLSERKIYHDLEKDLFHELKYEYPFYELMWETNPVKTLKHINAYWNSHVIDWKNLDFNRHGYYESNMSNIWNENYIGGDVFFWGKGLTFVNAGSNLCYSAALISSLSGDEKYLKWSKNLSQRYVETRQEHIGISGYQFSQCENSWCNGPLIKGDRAKYQYEAYLPKGHKIFEGTIFKPVPAVQRCQLILSEILKEKGGYFKNRALEEIKAWAKYAYRKGDNVFIPMLTDGFSLEDFVYKNNGYYGRKGDIQKKYYADSDFFWLFSLGYKLSEDELILNVLASICDNIGLGKIIIGDKIDFVYNENFKNIDYKVIYGLIELYNKTKNESFIVAAKKISGKLINMFYEDYCFIAGNVISINNPTPLSILYLYAVLNNPDINLITPVV